MLLVENFQIVLILILPLLESSSFRSKVVLVGHEILIVGNGNSIHTCKSSTIH